MKKLILFIIYIFVKFLSSLSNAINQISLYLTYLRKKANLFNTFLNIRNYIVKEKTFQNVKIKISVSSWWDLHRINNFKVYPVSNIFMEKKFNRKIVFLEIGANTGMASLFIAKKFKNSSVYSIEFEPNSYLTLSQNIHLNNLSNIIPLCFGLAKKNNFRKFYYNLNSSDSGNHKNIQSGAGGHSITFDNMSHHKDFFFNSIFTSYDRLSEFMGLKIPTHIFIDAHGAEKEIIVGMIKTLSKKKIYKIYVDTEECKNVKNLWVYKKLTKIGYKMSSWQTTKLDGDKKSTGIIFEKIKIKH